MIDAMILEEKMLALQHAVADLSTEAVRLACAAQDQIDAMPIDHRALLVVYADVRDEMQAHHETWSPRRPGSTGYANDEDHAAWSALCAREQIVLGKLRALARAVRDVERSHDASGPQLAKAG